MKNICNQTNWSNFSYPSNIEFFFVSKINKVKKNFSTNYQLNKVEKTSKFSRIDNIRTFNLIKMIRRGKKIFTNFFFLFKILAHFFIIFTGKKKTLTHWIIIGKKRLKGSWQKSEKIQFAME